MLPFYQKTPKIELHRHVEGSIRLETMVELAQEFDLDLPIHSRETLQPLVQVVPSDPHNFVNFLSKFLVLRQFIRSEEIIQRLVREAVEDAARDNISYLDLRFTPVALTRISGLSIPQSIQLVSETVMDAAAQHGMIVSCVPSINRHEPLKYAEQVVAASVEMLDTNVKAVDLAGDEANHTADRFLPLFREAQQAGLDLQIHAGEWSGAENVRQAVEEFGATRIGHGIRVVEDLAIMKIARDAGAFFEVCPSSNYLSGAVSDDIEHPIKMMMAAGLKATINTDDPSICDVSLSHEFALAEEEIGLSKAQIRTCLLNAADASYMTADQKTEYLALLKGYFTDFGE